MRRQEVPTTLLCRVPLGLVPTGVVLTVLVLSGCSGPTGPAAARVRVPVATAPAGPDSRAVMLGSLLTRSDLPGLSLRTYADQGVVSTGDPRLALCRPPGPVGPHEIANVFGEPATPGQAVVFEVVNAYATPAAARSAYDAGRAAAVACPRYTSGGSAVALTDLAPVAVTGADSAIHYRLRTPEVVTGDARTLVLRGRFTVLISGYGRPADPGDHGDLLAYQARLGSAALRRLRTG